MGRSLALVVDRDAVVRAAVREWLESRGLMTLSAESVGDAIEMLSTQPVELLIADLAGESPAFLAVVRHARQLRRPPLMVGLVDDGPASTEPELFDVIAKPVVHERLGFVLERAIRQLQLIEALAEARRKVRSREGYEGLVGRSGALERTRAEIERLAETELSVWFTGEPGCGKRHAALALHAVSSRAEEPFVVIDCESLQAPEWERQWAAIGGGLDQGKGPPGAAGGTVYLREVHALEPVLQQRVADTIGDWHRLTRNRATGLPAAPRVLAGTREDPDRAARQDRLLDTLYRRLAEARLHLPPLRERGVDIALLARHFVTSICDVNRIPEITLSPEALGALQQYAWPGNVRELRNTIEHAVILATEGLIRLRDLPDPVREGRFGGEAAAGGSGHRATGPFREAKRIVVDAFEREYLTDLLERHSGNVTAAAQQAGMLRSALQRLLRKHAFKSADFRRRRAGGSRSHATESEVD
jgi:DNA-binding NtrC family response regulator